ncbi:MAG: sigma-70 family RNA polymerase sigma factor [Planctomycetota bacterium]
MQTSSFQLTRWSIVRGAAASDPAVRQAALERLCAQYWYPLFAYLRRKGRSPELAADLVQGLFAHLLDGDRLGSVREGPGRFRSWLLTALQNYERDQRAREHAEKRGGGRPPIPIDAGEGERRFELQGAATDDPEVAYERAWALETLAMGRTLLEQELRGAGKGRLFDALAGCLAGDETTRRREELAAELGLSAVALRVTLHRLRARYRELLVALVADSLGERTAAGEELRALAQALGARDTGSREFP